MTIPNPEHLLDQAERFVRGAGSHRPRQADLRRAISNAYYGVFHAALSAVADRAVDLQSLRERTDYDPAESFSSSDAILAITAAREALQRLGRTGDALRESFPYLLLFPPR